MKKVFMLLLGIPLISQAQVKIGTNPTSINANAILDLESTNKGFLLPRLALTSTDLPAPLTGHVKGMMVYDTATAGVAPTNVTPGYYFNDGSKWIRLNDAATIYNSDGTITTNRTVNLGGKNLYFNGPGYVTVGGNTATSTLDINGSFSMPTRIVSSGVATTLDSTDHTLILTNAVGSVFTITLPVASASVLDREYAIVNQSATNKTLSTPYYDLNGNAQTMIPANTSIFIQADANNHWTQTAGLMQGLPFRYVVSGSATTLDATDHTLVFTSAVGANTITLPSAAANNGREYTIVNQSATPKTTGVTFYDLNGVPQTNINPNTTITIQADASGKWTETGFASTGIPGRVISSGTATTLDGNDHTLILTPAVTTYTITLPLPAGVPNREYILVNESSTVKTLTQPYYDFTGTAKTTLAANTAITIQADASGKWYQTSGANVTGNTVAGTLYASYEVLGNDTRVTAGTSKYLAGDSITFTLAVPSKVVITASAYMIPHLYSNCSQYTFAEGVVRVVEDQVAKYSRYLSGYQYANNISTASAVPIPATVITDDILPAGTHTICLQASAWGTVDEQYNFQSSLLSSAPASVTGIDLNATRTSMVIQVYNQ